MDRPNKMASVTTGRNASTGPAWPRPKDRKSTRLNSSHSQISYAVFCLKKKKMIHDAPHLPDALLPPSARFPKSPRLRHGELRANGGLRLAYVLRRVMMVDVEHTRPNTL